MGGWSKVIPVLDEKGWKVSAVQLPLTSLVDDISVTPNVLAAQKGLTPLLAGPVQHVHVCPIVR
jgi:hypothetical protein